VTVAHRHLNRLVPHQFGYGADVNTRYDQPTGKYVSVAMPRGDQRGRGKAEDAHQRPLVPNDLDQLERNDSACPFNRISHAFLSVPHAHALRRTGAIEHTRAERTYWPREHPAALHNLHR